MEYESFSFKGDPWRVFVPFARRRHAFILDSSLAGRGLGRYTFMGSDPFAVFSSSRGDGLKALRRKFGRFRPSPKDKNKIPFSAGVAGYISYDYGRRLEPSLPRRAAGEIPELFFGFYDGVVAVDHMAGRIYVTASGLPEREGPWRQKRAKARLKEMVAQIRCGMERVSSRKRIMAPAEGPPPTRGLALKSDVTAAQYKRAVRKALGYIRRGDIYQVNLAQRFFLNGGVAYSREEALKIYARLRQRSPSCFGSYFDAGTFQIVCSSPERFLHRDGQIVVTRPMKGTRPRGADRASDRRMKRGLRDSAKEKAELLMITDLERNDLGRVCRFGSVKVSALRTLEAYRTVYQATSTVEGRLEDGRDGFDLLAACFPGGSVTGCPKIRAMQVIDELEPVSRGIYTGALGYMDFTGNMDFNILIRTLLVQPREISFYVGSGIVADSSADAEYSETMVKARAMQQSLREVCGVKGKSG